MKYLVLAMVALAGAGCFRVHVDPLEVKPITLNVNLKVDRQLDDFFDFEKDAAGATTTATRPAQPAAAETVKS